MNQKNYRSLINHEECEEEDQNLFDKDLIKQRINSKKRKSHLERQMNVENLEPNFFKGI